MRICRPIFAAHGSKIAGVRAISTLPNNKHIYYFPDPKNPRISTLSYLPTNPPTSSLSIGQTNSMPPEPSTFTANPQFIHILQSVIASHATGDPYVQSNAMAYASQAGSTLGGFLLSSNHPSHSSSSKRSRSPGPGQSGAGPTASQGGMGGAGRGGWVHVSDLRKPPDFGRIADPEDIFGSVEVDGEGKFVGEKGSYQESGTYRIVTREGILGLSDFMRGKLVERLRQMEAEERQKS